MAYGHPPSHRRMTDPQPEICQLCGLNVGGAHLRTVQDVEGLRGYRVCDVEPDCRRFRSRITYRDRRRWNARESSIIGQSRVYEPGNSNAWWDFPLADVITTEAGVPITTEGGEEITTEG